MAKVKFGKCYLFLSVSSLSCGICCTPHQTGKCGTNLFFWWVWAQGWSPDVPGMAKNTYGPVGIRLIRGASGARQ